MCGREGVPIIAGDGIVYGWMLKQGGGKWWGLGKTVGNPVGNGVVKRADTRRKGEGQSKRDDVTKADLVDEFFDMERFDADGRLTDSKTIQINGNDTTMNGAIANTIIDSGNVDNVIDSGNSDGNSTACNNNNNDATTEEVTELVPMYSDMVDSNMGNLVFNMDDGWMTDNDSGYDTSSNIDNED